MTRLEPGAISVVIPTFERPAECERAVRSALAQTAPPLEVLVCDDGSREQAASRLRALEREDARVRYLRLDANTGLPARARNLGIERAAGEWVAFLDDDDQWLPNKLELQRAAIASGAADVLASNALRDDGTLYFPDLVEPMRPARPALLIANPVITSSAVVRRDWVRFPVAPWLRGVEDYAAWIALADRGARFLVLPEALVRYQDAAPERLSSARMQTQLALARLAVGRALAHPLRSGNARAALRWSAGAAYLGALTASGAARARWAPRARR